MKLSDLNLLPGSAVQLEFVNRAEDRYVSRVIGYASGKSLIVHTPKSKGRLVLVRLKQQVNVRLFSNTTVCAFPTTIVGVCTHPFPYLHLAYPEDIAADSVRNSRRVAVNLRCSVIYQPDNKSSEKAIGSIIDLSTDGAKLGCTEEIAEIGDRITVVATVSLGGITRVVSLEAIVRAILDLKTDDKSGARGDDEFSYNYGIQFVEVSEENYIALYGYVYSQIVEFGNAV